MTVQGYWQTQTYIKQTFSKQTLSHFQGWCSRSFLALQQMTHCETEASAEKRGKGKREELYKMYVLNMFDRYLKRVSATTLLTTILLPG